MINSVIKKCSWFSVNSGLLVLRVGVGAIFILTSEERVNE